MKQISTCLLFVLLLGCAGRQGQKPSATRCGNLEKGALVAADSMQEAAERLNRFYFSVRVTATGIPGTYEVSAAYGPNDGSGRLVMPRGGEDLCPVLRRGEDAYSFIIGFQQQNDTAFYPYFRVSWQFRQMMMRYTAAYSFE